MIKIDRTYTIRFAKGGVRQYAEFHESNGVLVNPRLFVSWTKEGEIPDVSKMTNINEVLEAIKAIAYNNKADIYLINHAPVFYDKKPKTQKRIASMKEAYESFIDQQITDFFNAELLPIIKKNNWTIDRSGVGYYILVVKDENGEWENLGRTTEANSKKEYEFEYLCAKALKTLNLIDGVDLTNEHGNYLFESHKLFCRVNDLEKCGFYLVE